MKQLKNKKKKVVILRALFGMKEKLHLFPLWKRRATDLF